MLLGLFAVIFSSQPLPAKADDPNCQNFSQTGFSVCGRFLTYWKNNGGLEQQGLPISPVFEEKNAPTPVGDGKVHKVQYFERARFEFHPENQAPYDVLLGLVGKSEFLSKYPSVSLAEDAPSGDCQKFGETGKSVCGQFLAYWNNHGGLAQQGLPLTGVFQEKNPPQPLGDGQWHKVQYFERARFEYHPDNSAPYDMLLGLVGKDQLVSKYGSGPLPATVDYPPDPQLAKAPDVNTQGATPDSEELKFLTLLNNYRQANGKSALVFDARLYTSAGWMAKDMATHNYISHTDSTGRGAIARIHAFGYPGQWVGENIAGHTTTAQDAMDAWQSDQIHIDNMLQNVYTHASAARYYYANSLNKWYWVLDMGS